ncbi:hypothetical protein C9374_009725 [Naegleria lovaniensis]|uniref:Uncharacterized protein n=1 Tax=Naegleria lovaniensis TaxID=51637 RepID=A0AA88H223_NAELO|nr:uncharacterized protein C9374_009725 [Naegleria lovaniensis]KAG2393148.1 hypothetical protein C9374_009725 [Naegleria lovaniensis]
MMHHPHFIGGEKDMSVVNSKDDSSETNTENNNNNQQEGVALHSSSMNESFQCASPSTRNDTTNDEQKNQEFILLEQRISTMDINGNSSTCNLPRKQQQQEPTKRENATSQDHQPPSSLQKDSQELLEENNLGQHDDESKQENLQQQEPSSTEPLEKPSDSVTSLSSNNLQASNTFTALPAITAPTTMMHSSSSSNAILTPRSQALMDKRRNTLSIQPYFVHKRGSQELPELIPPTNPYRKIATLSNLKVSVNQPQETTSCNNNNSPSTSTKVTSMHALTTTLSPSSHHTSCNFSTPIPVTNGNVGVVSTSNVKSPTSSPTLVNNTSILNLSSNTNSPHQDSSYLKFRQALENDDYSLIDFGMEVNSAQTSASEITFPVPKTTSVEQMNRGTAFYGAEKLGSQQGNYYFNHPQTSTVESCRKNSVIDDSLSDNGYSPPTEITRHYELYIICIGDLDHCLVNNMLKTVGGHMYTTNRQVSFILKNTSEKVTFTFNFYSQFNWYLMDFLKDEAKDCHGMLFLFNITHTEGWNELKQIIAQKYINVPDFTKPSLVLGTYSHSNRKPSVVDTSQVISAIDKWKEKQIVTYLEIDVEDKDECKMALTHLATAIIQNLTEKGKKENTHRARGNLIFSKICGSVSDAD